MSTMDAIDVSITKQMMDEYESCMKQIIPENRVLAKIVSL
jgi:hypothetical protein